MARSGPAKEGHIDKTMCNRLSAHKLMFNPKHMIHEVTRGTKYGHKILVYDKILVDLV